MRFSFVALLVPMLFVFSLGQGIAKNKGKHAWELPVNEVVEAKTVDLLKGCKWDVDGWPKGKVSLNNDGSIVTMESYVDPASPVAHINANFNTPQDWSGYDGVRFNVTAASTDKSKPITIRVILNEEVQMKLSALPTKAGITRTITLPFTKGKKDVLKDINRMRFYFVSREFNNGDKVWVKARDIELVKIQQGFAKLPESEVGMELYIGDGSEINIVPEGTAPKSKLKIYTGSNCALSKDEFVTFTFSHLFTGKETGYMQKIGKDVPAGGSVEIACNFKPQAPGYYWVTSDIKRGGKSIAGGRVGFTDYYQKKHNESMTHAILAIRMGMGRYIIDPVGGYGSGSIALMHTYDPRDVKYYNDFMRAYQRWTEHYADRSTDTASTNKDTEVMEAGVTGTIFAAYAMRSAGDEDGRKYAEWLIKNNVDFMIDYMQKPDGSTKWDVNEYYMRNIGEYRDNPTDARVPDTNQIGEWLRTIARTIIYFQDDPSEKAYVDKLYKAGLKSADFLVACSTEQIGNYKNVLRHFKLTDDKWPGKREIYYQEGRQCDVYLPRAMAGLSYFAYVRQLREGSLPQSYLDALEDTTKWAMEKMKPDTGWFDWQCGYEVEGGCHAFLGNQYLAEATQGYYLLCTARNDVENAKLAAECTRIALRFVTDHDRSFRNYKGDSPQEFWVGPYLYWQFSEYLGSIGEEQAFSRYLGYLHKGWAERRNWEDFVQRTATSPTFRANDLCHIHMSILAYPALRMMEENGKPFRYDVPLLNELESGK